MAWRAAARVVLPEEVGPERARRMGGGVVGLAVSGGGGEGVGSGGPEVGMVGGEDGGGYVLGMD